MVNNALNQIHSLISKAHDVIEVLDNDYNIRTYSPELEIERGKYGFNIMPRSGLPREFSGINTLFNLNIDIFMHYDLEGDDDFEPSWLTFMEKATDVLNAIYDKTNFPVGVSTVTVSLDFDNPIIEKERVIDLTFSCEYKIFATR